VQRLMHEQKQIGLIVDCPKCGGSITLPIAELAEGDFEVPPQNIYATTGFYHMSGPIQAPSIVNRGRRDLFLEIFPCPHPGCGARLTIEDGKVAVLG
jgi:hypothetical protein